MRPFYSRIRCHFPNEHYATIWMRLEARDIFHAAESLQVTQGGYYLGCGAKMIVEEITDREPSIPASDIYRSVAAASECLDKYRRAT